MANGSDFPFSIMDVADLLRLNIRRRGGSRVVYADCPICGDRRGKLGLYPEINTWRCYHCGEHGGMLALYGTVHGVSNSDAYREICAALEVGAPGREYTLAAKTVPAPEADQPQRASPQDIHRTLTALLAMLILSPAHREHLCTKRGLTDEQIEHFGFKSTPPAYLCRTIAARLMEQGCVVQGVPGFYLDSGGKWRPKFHQRTAGILIPLRGVDGLLQGLQIRLDRPIRDRDDPPEKAWAKYLPFSSTSKPMGVTSGSPIHFVGDPNSRVVYVTEGALKADVAHALTGRTFAATMGVNNTMGMDELFAFLRRNGTVEIIEAEDMDKYSNPNVSRGASRVHELAAKNGLTCRRLVWNPNYKGIDDWQLALRKKKEHKKEVPGMNMEQQTTQKFRVYQLDFKGIETLPFAFRGMEAMHKAGYEQPPADSYQLVYDGELTHPKEWTEDSVLERIFSVCNDDLPEGYHGHSLSVSDIVELYDGDNREFFYCDSAGFALVRFDAEQAKPMRDVDEDG